MSAPRNAVEAVRRVGLSRASLFLIGRKLPPGEPFHLPRTFRDRGRSGSVRKALRLLVLRESLELAEKVGAEDFLKALVFGFAHL